MNAEKRFQKDLSFNIHLCEYLNSNPNPNPTYIANPLISL